MWKFVNDIAITDSLQQFRMQRPEEKCQSKMKSSFLKDFDRFSSLPWDILHFKCYAFLTFFTFEGGKITKQHSVFFIDFEIS